MIIKVMRDGAIIPQVSPLIFMTMVGIIGAWEATMVTGAFTGITILGTGTDGTTGDGEVIMDMVAMDMVTDTDGADIIPHIAVMDMAITEDIMETSIMGTDTLITELEAMHTIEVDVATIIGIS